MRFSYGEVVGSWLRLGVVALALVPTWVWAHDVKGTALFLDFGDAVIQGEVQVPLADVQRELPEVAEVPSQIEGLLSAHLTLLTAAGAPVPMAVTGAHVDRSSDVPMVLAEVRWVLPESAVSAPLTLHSDLLMQALPTNTVSVFTRADLRRGRTGESTEILGVLTASRADLPIERGQGSWGTGFHAVFTLGLRHIAEGTDHLLFLLMLLLPAPLLVRERRFVGPAPLRQSVKEILKVVTGFTLGHSLTLAIGALWVVPVESRWVEVAIALSILVSAVNAVRPVFTGRELWVAAGFGLVHGLAFSSAIRGLGFESKTLAVGVLGFNLGVEVMQLGVVASVMPSLVWWARRAEYRWLRLVGAAFGGTAAFFWFLERAFAVHTPVPGLVEAVAAQGPWLIALLGVSALTGAIRAR